MIVCNFYTNTDAVGCVIQLILITDNTVQYTSSNNRTGDQAVVTLSGIIMGYYQLIVFEIESDQSLVPVPIKEEMLIIMVEPIITIPVMLSTLIPTSTTTIATFNSGITTTCCVTLSESGKQ